MSVYTCSRTEDGQAGRRLLSRKKLSTPNTMRSKKLLVYDCCCSSSHLCGQTLSLRPGGSRVTCSPLFADSVTSAALAPKWNACCVKPRTVMLRSRALWRGSLYTCENRWTLGDPGRLSSFLCWFLSVYVSLGQEWRKDSKIFHLNA